MSTERFDEQLASLLETAEPTPELQPGWEQRAMAAMATAAAAPARRGPRLVTVIVVALLLMLLAAAVFAAVRYFFVEGTLHFHGAELGPGGGAPASSRFFSGESEWLTPESDFWANADRSPVGDEAINVGMDEWPPTFGEIWKAKTDGSGAVNLTEIAGLGGVNCRPRWSPDGAMISFIHSDGVAGEGGKPCDTGFRLWVMNADGTKAHQVLAEGSPSTWEGNWSPDGSQLMTIVGNTEDDWVGTVITDIWGRDIQVLPSQVTGGVWSPDGSMIVGTFWQEGKLDGQAGYWNQLILVTGDFSDPEVLVQQFIVEAELDARYPTESQLEIAPDLNWKMDVRVHVGPTSPVWSPDSDRIAFLAALPWDPDGPYYRDQVEVWVYDLATDGLTQITDNEVAEFMLTWDEEGGLQGIAE